MYDMTDVTVLMLFRADSPERVENLKTSIAYINKYIKTNISVLEVSEGQNIFMNCVEIVADCNYAWMYDNDPVFFKTKWMNMLIKTVKTPIMILYEVDCIVNPEQLNKAVELIRQKGADIAHPYGNTFDIPGGMIYVNGLWRDRFKTKLPEILTVTTEETEHNDPKIRGAYVMGGVVIINTAAYRAAGGENENMYGWGPDDCEKIARMKILGYKYDRIPGNGYHMQHLRTVYNGQNPQESAVYQKNVKELNHIAGLTRAEIEKEIRSWWWK
jgi:predicted glycosyltransferase involved in capsule biosynthesis